MNAYVIISMYQEKLKNITFLKKMKYQVSSIPSGMTNQLNHR